MTAVPDLAGVREFLRERCEPGVPVVTSDLAVAAARWRAGTLR